MTKNNSETRGGVKREPKTTSDKNMILDTSEVIYWMATLLSNKKYMKDLSYKKFNLQEFYFIRDLIFKKPKGLLFHYLADQIMNDTAARDLPMFNAPSIRKLHFIYHFFGTGTAKEAAIKAGFSPKTAKQQGHRILRQIQGYRRES